jgi:hypothetical protein
LTQPTLIFFLDYGSDHRIGTDQRDCPQQHFGHHAGFSPRRQLHLSFAPVYRMERLAATAQGCSRFSIDTSVAEWRTLVLIGQQIISPVCLL